MNSYERVRAAVEKREPDRMPVDIAAEPVVWDRLLERLEVETIAQAYDKLNIDRRCVSPKYIGPPLKTFADGSIEKVISGGPIAKMFETSNGVVEALSIYPWADVEEIGDLEGRWGWSGKPEWWDFSSIESDIDAINEVEPRWIAAHGDPSGLQHLCMWVGDEDFLMTLASDEELAVAMIEKHNEYRLEHAIKTLEAGKGKIHELHGGGDYGTQKGLLISREMFCRYFKPLYQKFYREIKNNFDVEIFFHSCGNVMDIVPDLIEVGVTILNPVQSSAGMDPHILKSKYGNSLNFHGGIDIQNFLPFATPGEVRQKKAELGNLLGKSGGFIMAPTHSLQVDTPIENILALYL